MTKSEYITRIEWINMPTTICKQILYEARLAQSVKDALNNSHF